MSKNNDWTNTKVRALKGKKSGGKNLHALGDNLYARVRDDDKGTYVWIYRPKIGSRKGERTMLTLGSTDSIDLEDAQQWARKWYTMWKEGKEDPYDVLEDRKRAADLATLRFRIFRQVVEEYWNKRTDLNAEDRWGRHSIKSYGYVKDRIIGNPERKVPAMPIAELPVDKLVSGDFEKVINGIGNKTGYRFCNFMSGAMAYARKQGYYQGNNPADRDNLDINLPHSSEHHFCWDYDELPRMWRMLCEAETECSHDGMWTTSQGSKALGRPNGNTVRAWIKRGEFPAQQLGKATATYIFSKADLEACAAKHGFPIIDPNPEPSFGEAHLAIPLLKFLLLTSVRFSEANEMKCDGEIDLQKEAWIIPAERTKSKRKHVVPLVGPARLILEKRLARRDASTQYVFARGHTLYGADDLNFGEPLSNGCVRGHLKRICDDPELTIHGFRAGCGSWAESQFVHQGGILQAKYDMKFQRAVRGHALSNGLDYVYSHGARYETPCRILLNDWANYLIHGPSQPSESAGIVNISTWRKVGA